MNKGTIDYIIIYYLESRVFHIDSIVASCFLNTKLI